MTSPIALVDTAIHSRDTYDRMAQAIAFMAQNHRHQPDLRVIAEHVHLSEYHFQRLFTQWAGTSPKRFAQFLTLAYAKAKIQETRNLLEASLASGLSSPGRLHDLFVTLEAMSPGEFKSGGAGLQIRYGVHPTPFGDGLIATTARGICNLQFLDGGAGGTVESYVRSLWANAEISRDQAVTGEIRDRIFSPAKSDPALALHVRGTNFQIQVWRGLLGIPQAGLMTYQGLAQTLGRPTAARAVGNAVGKNPVGYLIPCHRVIRESGALGGYRWGLERKRTLLGWEASQQDILESP
ncbi:6-O-methylguanine DNA methyltransferase [filamentous cyanobacterium CCP5]|nr:6-O-methylguanine DNA methyltransferase [filamentous cyanobacterium CCP5]